MKPIKVLTLGRKAIYLKFDQELSFLQKGRKTFLILITKIIYVIAQLGILYCIRILYHN